MSEAEALLGVDRSVLGNRWEERVYDQRLGYTLSQRFGLPEIVGRLMAARGVDLDSAQSYLNPSLRAMMANASVLKDMDKAADRMAEAIKSGEQIGIIGDYDVDGATSTSLLVLYGRSLGLTFAYHIPDRIEEGYGPSALGVRLGHVTRRLC